MNYKYYFFDFDYTLVNSEKGIVSCFQITMRDFSLPVNDYEEIRATIGMPIEDAIELLTGLKGKENEAFLNRYREHANEIMTSNTHFYPHTVATLRRIKEAGCKTAIVSTKTRSRIEEKLRQENQEYLIDVIIGREDTDKTKPDPEGIFMAMERLQASKEEILYVGDSLYDAGAAKNAGVDFAAVLTGATKAEEFENYPAAQIIDDIEKLK